KKYATVKVKLWALTSKRNIKICNAEEFVNIIKDFYESDNDDYIELVDYKADSFNINNLLEENISIDIDMILKLLVAVDKLSIEELINFIQDCLIGSDFLETQSCKIFNFINTKSMFTKLKKSIFETICEKPKVLFDHDEFLDLKKDFLKIVIKHDDLDIKENVIWKYLINEASLELSEELELFYKTENFLFFQYAVISLYKQRALHISTLKNYDYIIEDHTIRDVKIFNNFVNREEEREYVDRKVIKTDQLEFYKVVYVQSSFKTTNSR
ncbi:21840_t:CDS:2, partial [Cetraspora pellucida]